MKHFHIAPANCIIWKQTQTDVALLFLHCRISYLTAMQYSKLSMYFFFVFVFLYNTFLSSLNEIFTTRFCSLFVKQLLLHGGSSKLSCSLSNHLCEYSLLIAWPSLYVNNADTMGTLTLNLSCCSHRLPGLLLPTVPLPLYLRSSSYYPKSSLWQLFDALVSTMERIMKKISWEAGMLHRNKKHDHTKKSVAILLSVVGAKT